MDNKEDISRAVEREVLEETGVCAEFQRLMTIQENHQIRGPGREQKSFVVALCKEGRERRCCVRCVDNVVDIILRRRGLIQGQLQGERIWDDREFFANEETRKAPFLELLEDGDGNHDERWR